MVIMDGILKNHGAEYLWTEKNIFYRTEISSFLKLPKKCSEWIIEVWGNKYNEISFRLSGEKKANILRRILVYAFKRLF